MAQTISLGIVSDIHYASAAEQARGEEFEFAGMPNVVLTPHIAAIREETMGNILPEIGENVAWAIQQDRAA